MSESNQGSAYAYYGKEFFFTITEVKYFRDCQEALDKGVVCSGVYTIKPDHLPPFEVSEIYFVTNQHSITTLVHVVYCNPFLLVQRAY